MTPRPVAAVVLTGGASRRMGRDKATLVVGRRSLVERTVAVVSARCVPVFVVAAPQQRLPALDAAVLRDGIAGAGPLVATARGLRAAAEAGRPRAFVCAVDLPLLDVALLDTVLDAAAARDVDVVLPCDGRDHYLAAVYSTALADRADALVAAGARSMRALVDTVDTRRLTLAPQRALTNVNTPADFAACVPGDADTANHYGP